jgi:hypothetical protein
MAFDQALFADWLMVTSPLSEVEECCALLLVAMHRTMVSSILTDRHPPPPPPLPLLQGLRQDYTGDVTAALAAGVPRQLLAQALDWTANGLVTLMDCSPGPDAGVWPHASWLDWDGGRGGFCFFLRSNSPAWYSNSPAWYSTPKACC